MAQAGSLGKKPYGSGGTVDSDVFVPKSDSRSTTIYGVPTSAGTCEAFLVDKEGAEHSLPGQPAVAGVAGELNLFQINIAIGQAFQGVFLRYVNTDATAGTVLFAGASSGGD